MDNAPPEDLQAELPASEAKPILRDVTDWLLLVAILGLLPMIALHCVDLWYRTDLKFFPILFLVPLFSLRKGKLASHTQKLRSQFTVGLFAAGGVGALLSALYFSPWLALLAGTLCAIGWLLQRFGQLEWYQLVSWTLPLWVAMLLPISDAADLTRWLETETARATSTLLDISSIPQLAANDLVHLRSGPISANLVCRDVGNPYLLLTLVLLMSMWTKRIVSVTVMTLLTIPLWAWLAAVSHFFLGCYLLEAQEKNIFAGYRNVASQAGVLVVVLGSIWCMQYAIQVLLSPFTAYSTTASGVHKFFNWAVLWPGKDPLRKRRSLTDDELAKRIGNVVGNKYPLVILGVAGLLLAIGGGYAIVRISNDREFERMMPLSFPIDDENTALAGTDLADPFNGMKQVNFEAFHRTESAYSEQYEFRWTYLADRQRITIQVDLPRRGYYRIEEFYETPVNELSDLRSSTSRIDD
ncbi:MAG: hypothetical protein KDB22_28310, partial [Planctomycetales bacterium]|nr:hypothetical protein [Planctomycetales bacterium]